MVALSPTPPRHGHDRRSPRRCARDAIFHTDLSIYCRGRKVGLSLLKKISKSVDSLRCLSKGEDPDMFPLSFGRTIEVSITDKTAKGVSEKVLGALVQRIQAEKPNKFSCYQHKITFAGSFFRLGWNWNLFTSISKGEIHVSRLNGNLLVSYKLWFTSLLIITSIATAIFGFLILHSGFNIQNLAVAIGIWIWLFGGNFLITVLRFHFLIRSIVKKVYMLKLLAFRTLPS